MEIVVQCESKSINNPHHFSAISEVFSQNEVDNLEEAKRDKLVVMINDHKSVIFSIKVPSVCGPGVFRQLEYNKLSGIEWENAPEWATHIEQNPETGDYRWVGLRVRDTNKRSMLSGAHEQCWIYAKMGKEYPKSEWKYSCTPRPNKS